MDFLWQKKTPDHTVFSRFRKKLVQKRLSQIFTLLKQQLQQKGFMSEAFSVVDATHLIAKSSLWNERDKLIKKKIQALNNNTIPKVSHDKQARIGCKGKSKFWYGYKENVCIDMDSGMINKIAVTPANIPDSHALKHIAPRKGEVYADKGYCGKKALEIANDKGCILKAIKRVNMKNKNKREDRKINTKRRPFERMFAHMKKKVRYLGSRKKSVCQFYESYLFQYETINLFTG